MLPCSRLANVMLTEVPFTLLYYFSKYGNSLVVEVVVLATVLTENDTRGGGGSGRGKVPETEYQRQMASERESASSIAGPFRRF